MSRVDEETEGRSLPTPEDDFQAIWNRMTARADDALDDDVVMSIALEAQHSVRKSHVK